MFNIIFYYIIYNFKLYKKKLYILFNACNKKKS